MTYSEDWLRPDYVPPQANSPAAPKRSAAACRGSADRLGRWPDRHDDPGPGGLMTHATAADGVLLAVAVAAAASGCGWHGLNSLPLPGTAGRGPGSYTIQAQLPDVRTIEPNSRVRVDDVTVGTVTKIERQGWHALVTMRINGDVNLPANATAKVGQTSLLGSLHIELAPPTGAARRASSTTDRSSRSRRRVSTRPPSRLSRAVAAAQRCWHRPGSGHHRIAQHGVHRARAGPAQPDRPAGQVHPLRQRPVRGHHRHRGEPELAGSAVRRPEAGGGQGFGDHPRRAGGAQRPARDPGRGARPARQVQRTGGRLHQPDQRGLVPNSATSGRCWSPWPTRVRH